MHPLSAFSVYLAGRHAVLDSFAAEVTQHLDSPDGPARASDLMWLWTLGAYEVTRTICQARACFSRRFLDDATDLKLALERVRVPNTKMERIKYDRKAPTIPVPSNRGPDTWDEARRDLRVGDPTDAVSARGLLAHYERVMASLTPDDVLSSHEDSFTR